VGLVVVLVAYPLSFGPACWFESRWGGAGIIFQTTFRPLVWAADRVRPSAWDVLSSFARFGMPRDGIVFLPSDDPDYPRYIANNQTLILHFNPPRPDSVP
jgi:hypothetical protein